MMSHSTISVAENGGDKFAPSDFSTDGLSQHRLAAQYWSKTLVSLSTRSMSYLDPICKSSSDLLVSGVIVPDPTSQSTITGYMYRTHHCLPSLRSQTRTLLSFILPQSKSIAKTSCLHHANTLISLRPVNGSSKNSAQTAYTSCLQHSTTSPPRPFAPLRIVKALNMNPLSFRAGRRYVCFVLEKINFLCSCWFEAGRSSC